MFAAGSASSSKLARSRNHVTAPTASRTYRAHEVIRNSPSCRKSFSALILAGTAPHNNGLKDYYKVELLEMRRSPGVASTGQIPRNAITGTLTQNLSIVLFLMEPFDIFQLCFRREASGFVMTRL